ncbi:hypothetical protein [Burkholderia phage FLC9]|nr:hypothetical protein [Burkholderia phage FLC9]
MPCYDSRDSQEISELYERNNRLARIACAMATMLEERVGVMAALDLSGLPPERKQEVLAWWEEHQAQDARSEYLANLPATMRIRCHRGGLGESMATMKTIQPTEAAIRKYFVEQELFGYNESSLINVVKYGSGPDTRIGWDETYLVMLDGHPAAMTDSQIQG